MRIMTSNIWGNFFNNPTELRSENFYKVYQKYKPDVIGFQEAASGWYDVDLFWKLGGEYNMIGTACCNNTNSTPVAIKKEYTILASGHEQLFNTPDRSKAITWAVFEKDDIRIAVCNTHFWWMRGTEPEDVKRHLGVTEYDLKAHCELRNSNARQLSELVWHLHKKYSCPVFAFGDMNAAVTEGIFEVFAENGIKKLYDMTDRKDTVCSVHGNPERGEDGRFHGRKTNPGQIEEFRKILCLPEDATSDGYFTSIDHIVALGDNFKVQQYRVIEDQDALDASDHSPVYADISLI